VLAAVFRAPITAVILLFELTREYEIIVPLMASASIAILTIDLLEPDMNKPTWSWWWQATNPPPKEQGTTNFPNMP
jgi:H+/Cl- antiporter ClcA